MLTKTHASRTFAERLQLAALTLWLPIVLLALLPVLAIGLQESAPYLSRYMGTDVTPWHLGVLVSAVAYTLYILRTRVDGLKVAFGVIISAFLVLDLARGVRGLAFLGDSVTVPLGAVAVTALVAIEFIGREQTRTLSRREKRGRGQ